MNNATDNRVWNVYRIALHGFAVEPTSCGTVTAPDLFTATALAVTRWGGAESDYRLTYHC